jgi:hypothetical protein
VRPSHDDKKNGESIVIGRTERPEQATEISPKRRKTRGSVTNLIAVAGLVLGIVNMYVAHRDQFDEQLNLGITPYSSPWDMNSGLACDDLHPRVTKPYRITLVNTGHVAVTIKAFHTRLTGSHSSSPEDDGDDFVIGPTGGPALLPAKIEPADVQEYVVVVNYPISVEAGRAICQGDMSKAEMVHALKTAKIDLAGRPIHPNAAEGAMVSALFARDISNFPPMAVTVTTEKGARQTATYVDKATF